LPSHDLYDLSFGVLFPWSWTFTAQLCLFLFLLEIVFSIAIFGLGGLDMDWISVMHLFIGVLVSYLDRWNWSIAWIGLDITSTAYFLYISFSCNLLIPLWNLLL
jgi:hypothetical protein